MNDFAHRLSLSPNIPVMEPKSGSLVGELWDRNFNLVLGLNLLSGRSFNDVLSYPVFPIACQDKFLPLTQSIQSEKIIAEISRWLTFPVDHDRVNSEFSAHHRPPTSNDKCH
jgi:hypothetical protein